jgi:EmrB/QacA subfamily drug resistance transporter
MLSVGLVAIDSTILATAVPAIVDDLGGFTQFPWLFSVYLLAQAVSVPVYGKLADRLGRKPVMLFGVGAFLLGSLLCGLAWSMPALIAFRAVQGLGAGAVQPLSMTIIGDIYTLQERAKVQGYVASVWALSSVVGPTLGGVFADYLSWRWIFFVNLPIGAAAAWMLVRRFHEHRIEPSRHRLDVLGASLLSVGGVCLLLALLEGGVRWAWTSPTSLALFATAAVLLAAFTYVETRVAEPVLPLWVFRHRTILPSALVSLVVGVLLMGLTSYVPLYAQTVLGHGAVAAGFALAAMTLGWPIAASNAGRLYLSIGFRATMTLGAVIVVAGAALLLTIDPESSLLHVALPCFVMGLGFGLAAAPSVIAAQSSVGWTSRGVATGSVMFARSVGSAIGVAVFGLVVNRRVGAASSTTLESLDPAVLHPAVHATFVGTLVVAGLMVVFCLFMPHRVGEQQGDD